MRRDPVTPSAMVRLARVPGRVVRVGTVAAVALASLTSTSVVQAADAGDSATGSGDNGFALVVGKSRISASAHASADGVSGHVRAQGDPDGDDGPTTRFTTEGEVTCLEVRGNRAAIKYRFTHAEGSAESFEGGGIQIFIEDNGDAVDATAFDPPQRAGVFDLAAQQCDDPNTRLYDPVESGGFVVTDA